jgi:DNA-binding MarR family transcriptional regulator
VAKSTVAGQALTEFILEIFRLNGGLLSSGDTLVKPFKQTSSRWQVMGAMEGGAQTVSEIARVMGLTRQSVQRTVDLLRKEGLCVSHPNPRHQRAPLIALTKKGESLLEQISGRQIVWANHLSEGFGPKRIKEALEFLRSLREKVEG